MLPPPPKINGVKYTFHFLLNWIIPYLLYDQGTPSLGGKRLKMKALKQYTHGLGMTIGRSDLEWMITGTSNKYIWAIIWVK